MTIIAKRLLAARKCRNLTQDKLAELLGVSPARVSSWEKGTENPDAEMIEKLSQVLSVYPVFFAPNTYWADDVIEDYHNARSHEEELRIFAMEGIPKDYVGRYLRLSDPQPETETSEACPDEWEKTLILKSRALNEAGKKALSEHLDLLLSSKKYCSK